MNAASNLVAFNSGFEGPRRVGFCRAYCVPGSAASLTTGSIGFVVRRDGNGACVSRLKKVLRDVVGGGLLRSDLGAGCFGGVGCGRNVIRDVVRSGRNGL